MNEKRSRGSNSNKEIVVLINTLVISPTVMGFNSIKTLMTLKIISLAQTSTLNSRCKYLTANLTSPLGYLKGSSSLHDHSKTPDLPPQICSSHSLIHFSKGQLHPSNCPSQNPESYTFLLFLRLPLPSKYISNVLLTTSTSITGISHYHFSPGLFQ